jgi:hypothetical protein
VHRSDEVSQRGCQMYRDMGLTLEVRAVVLIRVERALPVISPAYDRGDTEEQVKDRWRQYGASFVGESKSDGDHALGGNSTCPVCASFELVDHFGSLIGRRVLANVRLAPCGDTWRRRSKIIYRNLQFQTAA